jgi:Spy/CpxP family protein refolding chaperone
VKKNALRVAIAVSLFAPLTVLAETPPLPLPAPPSELPGEGMMLRRLPMDPFIMGIPPDVAKEVGLSPEQQRQVKQLTLDANEDLIDLDADLKRAQLQLEKLLQEPSPNEGAVLAQVDAIARAEAAVRKNRLGVMLRIRKLLGPDMWQKLEASMPRRQQRIIMRRGPNGQVEDLELRGPGELPAPGRR